MKPDAPGPDPIRSFTRIYDDQQYEHPTTVSHQGTVIAFAMASKAGGRERHIYYTVLETDRRDDGAGRRDVDCWDSEPKPLIFPEELDHVGYEAAGPRRMPLTTRSGAPVADGAPVEPGDIDLHLSTTARLTAGAPFQVVSDGKYVYVWRQSIERAHPNMAYVAHEDGARIPVADRSLLVDRFVFVDGWLVPKREVRFQRSRNRSLPAGPKDTLGAEDLERRSFFQPTHKLPFVNPIEDGRFAVVLVPTAITDVQRWHIFAHDARQTPKKINVYSVEQGPDGSFDTRGTRHYTCPNHPDVFERKPGACPVDGKDLLVPVEGKGDDASKCLLFDGKAYVNCGDKIDLRSRSFTIELWAKRKLPNALASLVLGQGNDYTDPQLRIGFSANHHFTFEFGDGDVFHSPRPITDETWHHWACVYDRRAGKKRIYMDGRLIAERDKARAFQGEGTFSIGGRKPEVGHGFVGRIDEVRVFARARTQAEIEEDMHFRLGGDEPGLIAYWRMDEGQGVRISDATGNLHGGTIEGAAWSESDAPIGQHMGVDRAAFFLAGHEVVSGLSVTQYAQHEQQAAGYDKETQPIKRALRVALAFTTAPVARVASEDPGVERAVPQRVAVLDFGVSRTGRLARTPAESIKVETLVPDGKKDLPMPVVHVDTNGLTLHGALLDFVAPAPGDAPQLFAAAERRVNLYFRGARDELLVAYYDTLARRARFSLETWGGEGAGGPIRFVARATGPVVDSATIRVDPGENTSLCTVTITGLGPQGKDSEVWRRVPRTARAFAQVLNGQGYTRADRLAGVLGAKVSGKEVSTLPLKDPLKQRIEKKTTLLAGDRRVEVAEAAKEGDRSIMIAPLALDLPEGASVRLLDAYDYSANATPGYLKDGSRWLRVDDSRAHGSVIDGAAVKEGPTPTPGCRWIAAAPGAALHFDPGSELLRNVVTGVRGAAAARFACKADVTVEAWVRPAAELGLVGDIVAHTYNGRGYDLSLRRSEAALRFFQRGLTNHVEVRFHKDLNADTFSLSLWVRPERSEGGKGYRSVLTSRKTSLLRGYALYADAEDQWVFTFGFWDGHKADWGGIEFGRKVEYGKWTHVAVTHDGKTFTTYVDGKRTATKDVSSYRKQEDNGNTLRIGAGERDDGVDYQFEGAIDDVSVWKTSLKAESIAALATRRLSDEERRSPDLAGYWHFDTVESNGRVPDRRITSEPRDGIAHNPRPQVSSPFWSLVGAVHGSRVTANGEMVLGRWHHVAMVHHQGHALRLRGRTRAGGSLGDYIDCGAGAALDITKDLTVEASIMVDDLTEHQPILAKGAFHPSGADAEGMPYALLIEKGTGRLVLAFVDEQGEMWSFSSVGGVKVDRTFHHVAVTRQVLSSSSIYKLTEDAIRKLTIMESARKIPPGVVKALEPLKDEQFNGRQAFLQSVRKALKSISGARKSESYILSCANAADPTALSEEWTEIRLYINGRQEGFHRYWGSNPAGNGHPLAIGRLSLGPNNPIPGRPPGLDSFQYFSGQIGEVRIWDTARSGADLDSRITGRERGLVAWWRVDEGEGAIIGDVKGGNHGTCHGAQWQARDERSDLRLYLDGRRIDVSRGDAERTGLDQLTLGAHQTPSSSLKRPFAGDVDEVRIWKVARTEEQLQDNMFRRLSDEREHLIAYYECEVTGTAEVRDSSGYGHHLAACQSAKILRFVVGEHAKIRLEGLPEGGVSTWELWFMAEPLVNEKPGVRNLLYVPDGMETYWDEKSGVLGVGFYGRDKDGKKGWERVGATGYKPGEWHHVAGVVHRGRLYLFVDGRLAGGSGVRSVERPPQGTWYLGSTDGIPSFKGWMREVRLWTSPDPDGSRILKNMRKTLTGNEPDLVGYWPLDKITAERQVLDHTTYKRHGRVEGPVEMADGLRPVSDPRVLEALYVDSTAPIGVDTPKARSALAGVQTEYNDTVTSRPSAQEYGEIQHDGRGGMSAVLKRCYAYVKSHAWHLLSDFKVGDLELDWVGQAQYDPQIIGFVEGAPPAPGENLTVNKKDYSNATSVDIVDADEVTHTYSKSFAGGAEATLSAKAGIGWGSKSNVGTTVASMRIEDTELIVGGKMKLVAAGNWLSGSSAALGTNRGRKTQLQLRGRWDEKAERFVPTNVGLAVVQSETADIYAMRLKHPDPAQRAMVAYALRPNADVPKDWNLIVFPMNPRYCKQGVLDGKVGLKPDADYPNAGKPETPYNSYFKPLEAYAWKARILREEEQLKAYYASFQTGREGVAQGLLYGGIAGAAAAISALWLGAIGPAAAAPAMALGAVIGGAVSMGKGSLPAPWKRNLVNTYVWTADGGLFAESEQTMDVRQESYSGNLSLTLELGSYVKGKFTVSKAAVEYEAEALGGGSLRWTSQKTAQSKTSFAVNVGLGGVEANIFEKDPPRKQAGKVDAYRFMTFYLAPSVEHLQDFEHKVVDPIWLSESQEPGAVALRQALSSKSGAPWRVLHRVTFVSRVVPRIGEVADPVERALQVANIESNYALIKALEPFVRDKTHDDAAFRDAAREAIRRYLPELDDKSARERIIDYLCGYFGVVTAR